MKRMQLIAAALCLIMITTVGTGVVAAKQGASLSQASSIYVFDVKATDAHGAGRLVINVKAHTFAFVGIGFRPDARYALAYRTADDATPRVFATATTTRLGILYIHGTWAANLAALPSSQGFGVVGAAVYSGTLQRINSDDRDYDLVYTDASGQKVTIYLDPNSITPNTLPSVIPTPVALDYVYNIDGYHYTVSFVYQGVTYSANWTPATLNPYYTYEAHYKGGFFTDFIFGTVWLNTWDEAQHKTVQTGAEGVNVHVWWQDPPTQTWELFDTGSTDSQGHFCAKVTGMTTKDYKVDFSLGDWSASTSTLSSTDRPSYC